MLWWLVAPSSGEPYPTGGARNETHPGVLPSSHILITPSRGALPPGLLGKDGVGRTGDTSPSHSRSHRHGSATARDRREGTRGSRASHPRKRARDRPGGRGIVGPRNHGREPPWGRSPGCQTLQNRATTGGNRGGNRHAPRRLASCCARRATTPPSAASRASGELSHRRQFLRAQDLLLQPEPLGHVREHHNRPVGLSVGFPQRRDGNGEIAPRRCGQAHPAQHHRAGFPLRAASTPALISPAANSPNASVLPLRHNLLGVGFQARGHLVEGPGEIADLAGVCHLDALVQAALPDGGGPVGQLAQWPGQVASRCVDDQQRQYRGVKCLGCPELRQMGHIGMD